MAETATAQERLFALREQIARLEGKAIPALAAERRAAEAVHPRADKCSRLALGIPEFDAASEGGLELNGITEIRTRMMRDAGTASGFALSIAAWLKATRNETAPVLWIGDFHATRETGRPYGQGLRQFGLDPDDFLLASPHKLDDALWLAESALSSGALAATILEVSGNPRHFGLTESRRLNLRARAAGRPLLLLRQAGEEEASSAFLRFLVEAAPALGRYLSDGSMLGGSIGHPVFRTTLEKSRNPAPLSFLLEWNPHDRQFRLAPPLAAAASAANHPTPADSGNRLPASFDRQDRKTSVGSFLAFGRAS